MTRIAMLALSKWAHFSWLPRGERARTARAEARANADLLARFASLAALRTPPALPPFALLPRPACAKVLRVAAALAHARSLRRIVSAQAQRRFGILIAPRVLHVIQRDARGLRANAEARAPLDVLDRTAMTAAGLAIALRTLDDPALRVLMQLRMPYAVAQRAERFGVDRADNMRIDAARDLLDNAYALVTEEAC